MVSAERHAAWLFALAALLAGCSVTEPSNRSAPAAALVLEATDPVGRALCEATPFEGCAVLQHGGRNYRFYISRPIGGDRKRALLVDIGGPGTSLSGVLPQNWASELRAHLGVLAEGSALVLVDEPWTTGSGETKCSQAIASGYTSARAGWRSGKGINETAPLCTWGDGRYGWSRNSFRGVVKGIVAHEGFSHLDMAALSFGAVRFSYVADLVGRAVLVRPAAAPGTENVVVLRARGEQVWRTLQKSCGRCTLPDVRQRIDRLLAEHERTNARFAWRSLPVTDFDIGSAIVAGAIGGREGEIMAWSHGAADLETAGKLSDSLWLRMGEAELSPGMLAYIDEYCQAYGSISEADNLDPLTAILAMPTRCEGYSGSLPGARPRADCVVAGTDDVSAPAVLASTWELKPGGKRVDSKSRAHWFADVSQCGIGE